MNLKPLLKASVISFVLGANAATGPISTSQAVDTAAMYYTYSQGARGGIAETVVDAHSGKILSQNVLLESFFFKNPHKIKRSDCGNYLLATSQHQGVSNLALVDLRTKQGRLLSVPRTPDDISVFGSKFIIGADDQMCYVLDAETCKITKRWNGKHTLYPEGRRIEYISTTPDGIAWTSWQKDSSSGRRKGSRIVAIDIATGRTISDLHMPRIFPQLHLADLKEQGPNPEIILPSPKTNTMLLSMDLYSGIAFCDLDAMRQGRWKNLTYHCLSTDGSWGTAFPDRALLYSTENNDYVFIANAGKQGGASWIDLRNRQIVQTFSTPPGLETPAVVANGRLLVSPVAGKTKYRFFGEFLEKREPLSQLYVFSVSQGENPRLQMRILSLPTAAYRAAPVSPTKNDLVLLTAGEKTAKELIAIRADTGKIEDRVPAVGVIHRITY